MFGTCSTPLYNSPRSQGKPRTNLVAHFVFMCVPHFAICFFGKEQRHLETGMFPMCAICSLSPFGCSAAPALRRTHHTRNDFHRQVMRSSTVLQLEINASKLFICSELRVSLNRSTRALIHVCWGCICQTLHAHGYEHVDVFAFLCLCHGRHILGSCAQHNFGPGGTSAAAFPVRQSTQARTHTGVHRGSAGSLLVLLYAM